MFGSFFWQNPAGKNSIKVFEDGNKRHNNFEQFESTSFQNLVTNTNTNTLHCQLSNLLFYFITLCNYTHLRTLCLYKNAITTMITFTSQPKIIQF